MAETERGGERLRESGLQPTPSLAWPQGKAAELNSDNAGLSVNHDEVPAIKRSGVLEAVPEWPPRNALPGPPGQRTVPIMSDEICWPEALRPLQQQLPSPPSMAVCHETLTNEEIA